MAVEIRSIRPMLAVMATPEELAAQRRRRGYWIRRARERKEMKLDTVAKALGYAEGSTSTISLWESGKRPVPSDKLESLAALLDLPARFLVKPPMTDSERLDAAVAEASALESEDWDSGVAQDPEDGGEPGGERRRRSA